MAGGSIFAGIFAEPYDIEDRHTSWCADYHGDGLSLSFCFVSSPFDGLIYSQILLSVSAAHYDFYPDLSASSSKVMGKFANRPSTKYTLWIIGIIVTLLNAALLVSLLS